MHLAFKLIVMGAGLSTFSGASLTETTFNSADVIFSCRCHKFPESYDAMCQICHDFKLDFVWPALISCEHSTIHNLAPTCFFVFFYPREHIDSHYADSCLSTIEYPSTQSIDKNTFSLLGLYENTLPNWFCFPDDAALSNGNGFVRCSAGGDVNELRERCRNLGQLAMI